MKKTLAILLTIIIVTLIGCNSSTKIYDKLVDASPGNEETYPIEVKFEGEVIEIDDLHREITVSIENNDKCKMIIPEYSLGSNNDGARDENGDYIFQMPTFKIGDKVKVETGELQFIKEKDGEEYLIGYRQMFITKIKN